MSTPSDPRVSPPFYTANRWFDSLPLVRLWLWRAGHTVAVYFVLLIAIRSGFAVLSPHLDALVHEYLHHPAVIFMHWVAFILLLFHSLTWFKLDPEVLGRSTVIQTGDARLSEGYGFAAWLSTFMLVAWMVLR